MKIKNRTKKSIKNFACAILLVLAMLLSSNLPLAFGVVNNINIAHAEYEPTNVVNPYEFTSSSGSWTSTTNGKSGDDLYKAFSTSSSSVDLYNNDYSLKPKTKYNGDKLVLEEGEEKSTEIDDYALSLQANEAPTKIEVDKKDDDENTIYEKDADGNFLFVPKLYTAEQVGTDNDLYDYDAALKGYKKILKTKDDNGNEIDKTDSEGNKIYEAEVFDNNNGDTDLYVQIEDTGTYYKKIAKREEVDSYYGYKITSDISLKADGWFVFSFWAWTSNTDATLVVSSGDKFSSDILISNTNGEWKQYYLFIESDGDNSTRVIISIYFGYEKSLVKSDESTAEPDSAAKNVTGAVFIDNLRVRNISETDFRKMNVTGDEANENKVVKSDTMRFNYALTELNASFNEELKVQEKMYGEEGYSSLESGEAGYQFEKYVSRYTDDNGDEDRSENKLAEVRWTYNNFFTSEIVDEKTEFQVDDIDEETGEPKKEGDEVLKKDGPSTFDADNKILKLENKSDAYALGLLSLPITIAQFRYYKLTLFVKGQTQDDKAVIKLLSNIKTGNKESKGALQVKSQSINAFTDQSEITNNWTEVTFYIQGSCYYDMKMQIAILADTASKIYVDNIRLESITSDTYRNQASAKRFDLAPSSTVISSSIENGYFNSITTSEVDPDDVKVPYTPYAWSQLDGSSDLVTAGIVSTQENFFEKTEFKVKDDEKKTVQAMLGNPYVPETKLTFNGTVFPMYRTNVLAIYSPAKEDMDKEDADNLSKDWKGHYFGYKSSQFSLSSSSVYEVTFEVYASSVNKAKFNGTIFANLIYSDNHVAEFSFTPTVFDEWQTYTFLVRTGSSSRTFSLELGVEDATGTVFFQRVNYKAYAEKDNPEDTEDKITVDEQYAEKTKAYPTFASQIENKLKFVDFDGDPTAMASVKKVEDKDYYKSLSHSLRESDDDKAPLVQGEIGVVDTSSDVKLSDALTLTSSQLTNPNVDLQSALMIYNDQEYATTVYPNSNSSLSSTSYYAISLWVKTIGVKEGSGLTISMNNISAEFDLVNTQSGDFKTEENNGWTKLTVLVETGTSSVSGFRISFELGNDDNKASGVALISGINLKKLASVDEYTELTQDVDENDKTTIVKSFAVTEEDTGNDDVDNLTLATFFLVFSSILLVAAIVFAVVAVYIKKVPKKAKANAEDSNGSTPTPKDGFV